MTTKGELVRAILFPPPLDLAFYDDFLKSVRVFLALGLIGMAYSLYMWISLGVSFSLYQPFSFRLQRTLENECTKLFSGDVQGVSPQQFGHLYIRCQPHVASSLDGQQCFCSEKTPEERHLLSPHQAHKSLRWNRRCGF